eukprot:4128623-Pyramimonas_sp.AAC.1
MAVPPEPSAHSSHIHTHLQQLRQWFSKRGSRLSDAQTRLKSLQPLTGLGGGRGRQTGALD